MMSEVGRGRDLKLKERRRVTRFYVPVQDGNIFSNTIVTR